MCSLLAITRILAAKSVSHSGFVMTVSRSDGGQGWDALRVQYTVRLAHCASRGKDPKRGGNACEHMFPTEFRPEPRDSCFHCRKHYCCHCLYQPCVTMRSDSTNLQTRCVQPNATLYTQTRIIPNIRCWTTTCLACGAVYKPHPVDLGMRMRL